MFGKRKLDRRLERARGARSVGGGWAAGEPVEMSPEEAAAHGAWREDRADEEPEGADGPAQGE